MQPCQVDPCNAFDFRLKYWESVIPFNPLVAAPCNRALAWIEVDHLLQKYLCLSATYYSIVQILLCCSILFYLIILLNVQKSVELYTIIKLNLPREYTSASLIIDQR